MQSLAEEINRIFADGSLQQNIAVILRELRAELQNEIREEMNQIHAEFISLAEEVLDEEELRRALVLRYIELKSRWIMYNTRLQFRLLVGGENDERLVYSASAISLFLEAMESILTQSDVESINQFLVEPVVRFRDKPTTVPMPVTIMVKYNTVQFSGISIVEFRKK